MSFARPTLRDLVARAELDFATQLPGADSRVRRSVLYVMARVHAGAMFGLYGFLDWIFRQWAPDTAETEQLERHASFWGLARSQATRASGTVIASGAPASTIAEGVQLQRADGVLFEVLEDAVIAGGGNGAVSVRAIEGGAAGNTDAGATLTFASPVAGVDSETTVDEDGLSAGADIETDEGLRQRVLARLRQPPQGGAVHDYVAWARAVAGVTRAWVRPDWMGPGSVGVLFVCDGREDIFPVEGDTDAVQAYIEARRPVTAAVFVVAPVAVALDLEINIAPNTEAVRAAVEAELRDLLVRVAEPGGAIRLSWINEAISAAAGEQDHVLVSPAANVEHAGNEMPVLGEITWSGLT